jgi:hypothetical protein
VLRADPVMDTDQPRLEISEGGVALVSAVLTLLIVVLVGPIVPLVVLMVGLFMVMNWDHNKKQNERGQRL